jgi:CubicO group peptidase (beta-lactamase class C family)
MMLHLLLLSVADPPPYTFNLDQSVTCPRDVNDAWYSHHAKNVGKPMPVHANSSAALKAVIASLPTMLDENLKTLHAPSAMLVASVNGDLLAEVYRGTARLGKQVPVTGDSGFMIASNSKIFTSVMMYQLRDRGLLPQGLDTTVASIMRGWVEPAAPVGSPSGKSRRGLTLRALATHSSGLPREVPAGTSEAEILANVGKGQMLFPQFASTAYSNLGLNLLGRAIEKVTGGTSWEEWVATEIMAPLGMHRSGPCLRSAAEAASIVDGVEPLSGNLVPRPYTNTSECPWDSPAGRVFSTPADMARWAGFLSGAYAAPDVLDPSTVLELRTTAALQPDGISAVSGATFEAAFSHGRWTFNKLGCLDGYRSAISMVPQLGLTVFAAAASTCDYFGDGDAVGFPIVSKLIPALDTIITARFEQAAAAPPNAHDFVGSYCGTGAGQALVISEAGGKLVIDQPGPFSDYPWTLLPLSGEPDGFRLLMREPSRLTPGCSAAAWPGAQLCHTSCFRQMGRGDIGLLFFQRNASGHVASLSSGTFACDRTLGRN